MPMYRQIEKHLNSFFVCWTPSPKHNSNAKMDGGSINQKTKQVVRRRKKDGHLRKKHERDRLHSMYLQRKAKEWSSCERWQTRVGATWQCWKAWTRDTPWSRSTGWTGAAAKQQMLWRQWHWSSTYKTHSRLRRRERMPFSVKKCGVFATKGVEVKGRRRS